MEGGPVLGSDGCFIVNLQQTVHGNSSSLQWCIAIVYLVQQDNAAGLARLVYLLAARSRRFRSEVGSAIKRTRGDVFCK